MYKTRLWFARVMGVYALLIFTFLAYLYIFEPLEHIAMFGISASGVPESVNFLRAGPGALFLGMALFSAYGLTRPERPQLPVGGGGLQRLHCRCAPLRNGSGRHFPHAVDRTAQRRHILAAIRGFAGSLATKEMTTIKR